MLLSKKVIHRNFLRESSALNQVQQLHVLVPLDRLMKFVRLDFSTVWQHPLTITMFQGGQPHVLKFLGCQKENSYYGRSLRRKPENAVNAGYV